MEEIISKSIGFEDGIVNVLHALQSKWAGSHWVGNGKTYNDISWLDTSPIIKPSEEEVNTEVARLQAEYDALQYQRDREPNYPNLAEQFDLLWHAIDADTLDKTSDFYTTLKAVKDAHPKG
jgi:hypothetical protein